MSTIAEVHGCCRFLDRGRRLDLPAAAAVYNTDREFCIGCRVHRTVQGRLLTEETCARMGPGHDLGAAGATLVAALSATSIRLYPVGQPHSGTGDHKGRPYNGAVRVGFGLCASLEGRGGWGEAGVRLA